MKDQIDTILKEKSSLLDRVKILDAAVKAMQEVCLHKDEKGKTFRYVGNNHNQDFYKCEICQKEETR